MQTIIQSLRQIIGEPQFYKQMNNGINNNWQWDYGAMIEYITAALLVLVVVSWAFRFLKYIFLK